MIRAHVNWLILDEMGFGYITTVLVCLSVLWAGELYEFSCKAHVETCADRCKGDGNNLQIVMDCAVIVE